MNRRSLAIVTGVALAQALIAVGSYGLMLVAERSGLGVFRTLERSLVFVDVPLYYTHANRTFAGQIPYRDDPIEYPIGALPFLYAPRLLAKTQSGFVVLFAAQMLAWNAALVAAVAARVAKTEGESSIPRRLAWLTAFFACVAPFVIGRYDAVPAFLGFVAACAWFGGLPGVGGGLAAVGALAKVVPGAVAMIGFLAEGVHWFRPGWIAGWPHPERTVAAAPNPRSGRDRPILFIWTGTFFFIQVLAVGALAWIAIGREGVRDSLRYHSGRGIEIGSVASGLLWLDARVTGQSVAIVHDHDSLNLVTPRAATWSRFAILGQVGLMAAVGLLFLHGRGRDPLRFAGAAVLAFAIGGKVLSPQYLIWIMPFVAAIGGPAGRWARPLFLAASILTMILYPWGAGGLRGLEDWAFVTLNLRNSALLATFASLIALPSREPEGDFRRVRRPLE